jgi:hypothetical protein
MFTNNQSRHLAATDIFPRGRFVIANKGSRVDRVLQEIQCQQLMGIRPKAGEQRKVPVALPAALNLLRGGRF